MPDSSGTIAILIIDDHALFRESIARLLDRNRDAVSAEIRHTRHLLSGRACAVLHLHELRGQALRRCERSGAGFLGEFHQRIKACFQPVDLVAQRFAAIGKAGGNPDRAFFDCGQHVDQLSELVREG